VQCVLYCIVSLWAETTENVLLSLIMEGPGCSWIASVFYCHCVKSNVPLHVSEWTDYRFPVSPDIIIQENTVVAAFYLCNRVGEVGCQHK